MSSALGESLSLLEDTITYTYDIPRAHLPSSKKDSPSKIDPTELLPAYAAAQDSLVNAVKLLKLQLSTVHESLDRRRRLSQHLDDVDDASKEVFAISLFVVSLLQVRGLIGLLFSRVQGILTVLCAVSACGRSEHGSAGRHADR